MKYLVLGSKGQIGTAVVEYLETKGEEVYTFDIMDHADEDLRIHRNIKFLEILSRVDFVYFLAWDVGGSKYLSKYQTTYNFLQSNLKIMSNVFEALEQFKKPFLFTSTQMSQIKNSEYGLTKLLGEKLTKSLGGITVQLWNVYGYEELDDKSHVITDFIKQAKYKKQINMLTDGVEQRQFLYSLDCAECFYNLSKNYQDVDKSIEYHVSSFEWISIKDLASLMTKIFPNTEIVYGTKKDNVQYGILNEPNTEILRYWKPTTTLEDGIRAISKKF